MVKVCKSQTLVPLSANFSVAQIQVIFDGNLLWGRGQFENFNQPKIQSRSDSWSPDQGRQRFFAKITALLLEMIARYPSGWKTNVHIRKEHLKQVFSESAVVLLALPSAACITSADANMLTIGVI